MYKLEILDGAVVIKSLLYLDGEESELRDKISYLKSIGTSFKLWKETVLN